MRIDQLSDNRNTTGAQKATSTGQVRPPPVAKSDVESSGDNVDMSMIGRIMARSVKDLANDDLPRPEKTDQFKDFAERPPRFSDSVIERLLRRMAG